MAAGEIVSSFAAPGANPFGLAWDGTNLWNADNNGLIYKLNPANGAIISWFASPGANPFGLAWDGTNLWNADRNTDRIYKLNPTSGAVVSSFAAPGPTPAGLTWDGAHLWCSDLATNLIYKLNPTSGAVVSSFAAPGANPFGLAWDGTNLWHAAFGTDLIYKLNPANGATISSFASPGPNPSDLAWDGTHLWSADYNTDLIYKHGGFNQPPNAPTVSVPASIDRAQTNRISVPLNDPDTGDSQSKLDIQWWDVDSGGSRVGAVHSYSHSTPTQYWDAPGGTFTLGAKEMQARSYDAQGLVSPWSASAFFTAADAPPGPVIVAPTNGATIGQQYFVFQWSTPAQDAYEAQLLDGSDAIVTALPVRDSSSGRSVSFGNIPNNVTRKARIRVRKGGIWSGWVSVTVNISYTPPADPIVTTTPDPDNGALLVHIDNPTPAGGQPDVAFNDVLIDDRDGKGWIRKATMLPTNSTWPYWTPRGGIDTGVKVVSTATNDTISEGVAP